MRSVRCPLRRTGAFTLVELLVSMAVLTLLLVLILQLTNGATAVITAGNKHIDVDSQARALLDRMAIDFGAMVKRTDVDYYLKGRPAPADPANPDQAGNDQIAFYSEVPGYNTGTASPVSLVAYRLNPNKLQIERLGKGLVWNGSSSGTDTPLAFLPVPLASPLPSPMPTPTPTPTPNPTPPVTPSPLPAWPQAADPTAADPDYEASGPQVFRFEYYYVLKGQWAASGSAAPVLYPSILSGIPWDTRPPMSHTSLLGLRDVAAIGVVIAVIDPRSRLLASNAQLTTLAGQMADFSSAITAPGQLEKKWQAAVDGSTLPHAVTSSILIYGRTFYLNAPAP